MRAAAEIATRRGIPVCKPQRGPRPSAPSDAVDHLGGSARNVHGQPKSKPQFVAEIAEIWQAESNDQARARILSRGSLLTLPRSRRRLRRPSASPAVVRASLSTTSRKPISSRIVGCPDSGLPPHQTPTSLNSERSVISLPLSPSPSSHTGAACTHATPAATPAQSPRQSQPAKPSSSTPPLPPPSP
jgi:hypothetical protein